MISDTNDTLTHAGRVTSYTVENGHRWLTGYPVWIGDKEPVLFKSVESQLAYIRTMDAELPADVPINYNDDEKVTLCIGRAVYGIDYGRGSVARHFAGHTPRGAYQIKAH